MSTIFKILDANCFARDDDDNDNDDDDDDDDDDDNDNDNDDDDDDTVEVGLRTQGPRSGHCNVPGVEVLRIDYSSVAALLHPHIDSYQHLLQKNKSKIQANNANIPKEMTLLFLHPLLFDRYT